MGYTHYWTYDHCAPGFAEAFAHLQVDAKRIFDWAAETGIPLAGYDPAADEYTTGAPLQGEGMIAFNGVGADEYETFVLELDPLAWARENPDDRWGRHLLAGYEHSGRMESFCKTNRLPYDVVVGLVLLRAAARLPGFTMRSDGKWNDEWLDGASVDVGWLGGGRTDLPGARPIYRLLFDEEPIDFTPANRAA